MTKPKYTYKSNKTLYTHKRMQLSEDIIMLPDGKETTYLRYDNLKDSVCLLVQNNDNSFLLLNEYTYPIDKYIYQMPGGLIEENEDSLSAAKRELLEETGLLANKIDYLGSVLQDHRRSMAKVNVYFATNLTQTKDDREEHEFMNLEWFSFKQMLDLVNKNKIKHYGTLVAWGLYLNNLVNLQQK